MLKILDIGNSFGQDGEGWLHQVLDAAGVENLVVNLMIGGCPLEKHWSNIESGEAAYGYEENGVPTGRMVSIQEILHEQDWDYIVTQQASHDSGWAESYEPFLGLMVEYLHRECPNARLCLQHTWAYEPDSTHWGFMRYNRNQQEMYERLSANYRAMAEKYGLIRIPSGEVVQRLRGVSPWRTGERSICRDGFHMDWLYGRYALACTWARKLVGVSVTGNSFVPERDGEAAEAELLRIIQRVVDEMV